MKKIYIVYLATIVIGLIFLLKLTNAKEVKTETVISFYDVPLVCGAAPEIGCGSRVKPLFIEAAKHPEIKEAWINRPGTVIAFIWNTGQPNGTLSESLYKQYNIEAKLIADQNRVGELIASLNQNDQWYKDMEVDQLSIEEAGVIARKTIDTILNAKLLNEDEAELIKKDIEEYMKLELVKVRSFDELINADTEWKQNVFGMFVNHIGEERAMKIAEYMGEKENCKDINDKSCCEKSTSEDCKKK